MSNNKKWMCILLTMALLFTLAPGVAQAADIEIEAGLPTITPNIGIATGTTINFAGQEWWVIGYNGTGVYTTGGDTDSVTLLEKDNVFGNTAFRAGQSADPSDSDWKQYSGDNWWYQGVFTQPNDYKDSTLQRKMVALANDTSLFPAKEYALIKPRTLTESADGIGGSDVGNQKLWPLSVAEANTIGNDTVRSFGNYWWLRSPGVSDLHAAVVVDDGSVHDGGDNVFHVDSAARPALSLDLTSVIFTSAAAGGKSAVAVGDGLVGATAPTAQNLKFTVLDTNLSFSAVPTATAVDGRTITFSYTATATAPSTYDTLSAIVEDNSGAVKYYGKLDDSPESSDTSGTASVTVPDGLASSDALKIFVEECNGEKYTDFCSNLVPLAFTEQTAPNTANGVGETAARNDGKITGTTALMEYSNNSGTSWIACPGTEVTGLAPGSYQVRLAGNVDGGTAHLASPAATVTVGAYVPPHTHSYGTTWQHDADNHWHQCTCGAIADTAAHTEGSGVITLQPTSTTEGTTTYSCTICGRELRTETIAATGSTGGGSSVSSYSVKFNTNGGSSIANVYVNASNTLAKPTAPTREGYTFGGWFTDSALTKEYDFSSKVNSGFTLYAKWIAQEPQQPTYKPMTPLHSPGTVVEAVKTKNALLLNGQQTQFPAVNIGGYNWLKLRDVAELLNGTAKQFSISYNATTGIIDVTTGQSYTPIGDELTDTLADVENAIASPQRLRVNGEFIDVAAYNIGGYNYLRLRDLAIILDFMLTYDDATGQITPDFGKPYSE